MTDISTLNHSTKPERIPGSWPCRGHVGVTDDQWYHFLAVRPEISVVNFWRPGGGREFRAIAVDEPFFFKTHHPHNRVVGGGFFDGFASLRVSEAWKWYGFANGVDSLEKCGHA
jgi:putative restriction endonuclease